MTAPHYGKRNLGLGTAAAPGDTLLFNFASYNDSGDSEVLSGFAVSDIEVIKDGSATVRATDSGYSLISDTGMVGDRAGLYRFRVQLFNTADDASFYANGSWYQVFVDSVTIDGKTVRFWAGSFEIGEPRANIVQIAGDTGAANYLKNTFAAGFADTGINQRLAQILSDVDTGLRAQIADADTGIHDAIADLDTGIRALLALRDTGAIATAVWAGDTGLRDHITNVDTGLTNRLSGVLSANVMQIRGDTGAANQLQQAFATTPTYFQQVDVQQIDGDTGAANQLETAFASGFNDTGINNRLAVIAADTDTGIQSSVNVTSFADTGVNDRLARILADTDTGIQSGVTVTAFSDTGVNDRLAKILADTDTGIQSSVNVTSFADTGVNDRLGVGIAFDTGGWAQVNVRKVNSVGVIGIGDTGTGNTWRPTT